MTTKNPARRIARSLVVPGSIFILLACLCAGPASSGALTAMPRPTELPSQQPDVSVEPSTPGPTESASPAVLVDLGSAQIPPRDRYDLARRFQGAPVLSTTPVTPIPYEIGSTATFWVMNGDTDENSQITAELIYLTKHVAMWVEQGISYDKD